MTVRFKGTELRPVLAEAVANQCRVILVKDQGVYFLAERGERRPDGRQKTIAYAAGCNPDVDAFDDWWELARAEFGGDDFGEFFDPQEGVFARILRSEDDLDVSAAVTHLSLQAVPLTPSGNWPPIPGPRSGGLFLPGNADSRECRLPLACAPSRRHASGHVPLTSVSDMPRQPRSSRLRRGSDRVDHTSSHRHPCANGHRFSMAMPPSCSINPRGGSTPSPPWVGCVSASLFSGDSP